MSPDIRLISAESDMQQAAAVMQQLRPQFTVSELTQKMLHQASLGYQVLAAYQDAICVGVAGFVTAEKLAWGKHLYIDDLVVAESGRSLGVGEALLNACMEIGREQQCVSLHLDSGVQRFAAHRFYLRHRMDIISHHFAISL